MTTADRTIHAIDSVLDAHTTAYHPGQLCPEDQHGQCATRPRPVPTPEDRMRDARTDRSFATYLDATERDQLDARAATAEQERDDALDDRDNARRERDDYARSRNHFADLLQATAAALHMPGGAPIDALPAAAGRLRAELDEWISRRPTPHLNAVRADRDQARRELAEMREARDVLRQQLDHYRTVTRRLGTQAAEAAGWEFIADQTTEERDHLRRLLNQTTAALNVALHHANDNTSHSPTTDHYKQRAAELDGCRIALQEAIEATSVAPSSVPPRRAQEPSAADLLRQAAAGRREYAKGIPEKAEPLELQAHTLEAAACVVEGDLSPLYDWLPSWKWTDDMHARLHATRNAPEPS